MFGLGGMRWQGVEKTI